MAVVVANPGLDAGWTAQMFWSGVIFERSARPLKGVWCILLVRIVCVMGR